MTKIALILFGLFLTIIILEIGLRIGGFTILSLQEHRNLQSIKKKGTCHIMCLGESTTQNQYPLYLEEILNQSNIGIKFSVIDKGISGTNTAVILGQLESNLDKYQPDIVVTMMGINDGKHMPCEIASTSKIALTFRSFKVYKLVRLLWLHMVTKLKETGFCVQDVNKQKDKPKEVHKELRHPNPPDNDSAYRDLGWLYRDQGKFAESEQAFKKAIELNPKNDSAYRGLGWIYKEQGKFAESEQTLKKVIELNPDNDSAYRELGWLYRDQGKFAELEHTLKKVIELNPDNDSAYRDLGWFYRDQGKFAESEHTLKKAVHLNPDNDSAYRELGWLYRDQGKFAESEQAFKKAIELNPKNDSAYIKLGWLYLSQGKYAESEQVFKKVMELDPGSNRITRNLAIIYYEIGNNELSEVYAKKTDNLRDEYYSPETINNYHTLEQILDKRKIKLVCVQYPVRNIEPLKKIFKEKPEGSIIFVDNERIFKDAVRREGYKEYFKDMFGGDFGHCTEKGNRLLAENIADVILKKYFFNK